MTKKRIRLCYDNSKEEKNVNCVDVWQTEHIRTVGSVVIVTVYKDTRGRARGAAGDHSLLRSGLIFIRSVLNFSPSNSHTDTSFSS